MPRLSSRPWYFLVAVVAFVALLIPGLAMADSGRAPGLASPTPLASAPQVSPTVVPTQANPSPTATRASATAVSVATASGTVVASPTVLATLTVTPGVAKKVASASDSWTTCLGSTPANALLVDGGYLWAGTNGALLCPRSDSLGEVWASAADY